MNSKFNTEEFECLVTDLKDANPEMSDSEILELASLVHSVQVMPEIEAPKNLFDKVKAEISYQGDGRSHLENNRYEKLHKDVSLTDSILQKLQTYLLPFGSGAVAMLLLITVFDLPQINTLSDNSMQHTSSSPGVVVVSNELSLPNASDQDSSVISMSNNQGNKSQVSQKSSNLFRVVSSKNPSKKPVKRPKIAKLDLKKSSSKVQALGIGREVSAGHVSGQSTTGSVRSKMMASLKSRKDDWITRIPEHKKFISSEESGGNASLNQFDNRARSPHYAALSSLDGSIEKQINNELTPVYTDKSATSKEALEIHWKLSIRELSRARNLMESTVNETSHIRHLNTEDLEDYSEISGEIITDSFFLKLNFSKLKKLLETAKDVGSFSILHSDGEKSFMSLYDYLNQNPDRGNLDLDVRLLLYIN